MPIIQGVCNVGKAAFLRGTVVTNVDVLKIALYTSLANLGPSTTVYTASGEVVGTSYIAGGTELRNPVVGLSDSTAWLTFDPAYWENSTITARGALIYDSSKANVAIAVLDFGADRSTVNQTFKVTFPAPSATTAVIRLT